MAEFTGVVATEGSVESLLLAAKRLAPFATLRGCSARDFVRGRNSAFEPREAERHPVYDGAGVNGLSPVGDAPRFESMLSESFGG